MISVEMGDLTIGLLTSLLEDTTHHAGCEQNFRHFPGVGINAYLTADYLRLVHIKLCPC